MADEIMRHWVRFYDKWPTYPQVFVDGKLVGGLDVIKEKLADGSFEKLLPESAFTKDPTRRLKFLISQNKVVLLTEGLVHEAKDPHTREVVDKLVNLGVKMHC